MSIQEIIDALFTCQIKWKKVHENAVLPKKAKPGDSGFDVYAVEDFVLERGVISVIPTGLQLADITPGFELQVRNRSGNGAKGVTITNSPGTVDNQYRGVIGVIMTTEFNIPFKKGDRIAQLVPARVVEATHEWVNEVTETQRGACGFGSTGK